MRAYGCIYALESPSGKFYIGQTTQEVSRYIRHAYKYHQARGRGRLKNAIVKYGYNSFKIHILASCFSKDSLNDAEVYFISQYDSIKNGYNCTTGGNNCKFTEEVKAKIAKANLGKPFSQKSRDKVSLGNSKYIYLIKDPSGKLYTTISLNKFSKENGLHGAHLSKGSYKGWRLISKEPIVSSLDPAKLMASNGVSG